MSAFRFLTDEDFNGRIVRGLWRRKPELDIVRVQDVGLAAAADRLIVQWAADQDRLVLTHDARSMPRAARDLARSGRDFPGMVVLKNQAPIGICIDQVILLVECSEVEEWRNQIVYLPWQ